MRAVVQRVSEASVLVDGEAVAEIGGGLVVLVGVATGDGPPDAAWMAEKVVNLRIFPDDAGAMNRSVSEVGGAVLAVSQFTLYGDARRGRRPSFVAAAPGPSAEPLYRAFCESVRVSGVPVAEGVFGAHMDVRLTNDGPVTILLDSSRAF